jgi:hypothetical protein
VVEKTENITVNEPKNGNPPQGHFQCKEEISPKKHAPDIQSRCDMIPVKIQAPSAAISPPRQPGLILPEKTDLFQASEHCGYY